MLLEPLILLQGVREVSKLANPDSPAEASQRAFDKARSRSPRFKDLPAARNIAATLKLSWSVTLEIAHKPQSTHSNLLGVKRFNPRKPWLTDEYIGSILKIVARRLGVTTLSLTQYRVERHKLLEADRARWLHGRQLRLPTDDQIRIAAGDWDKALAIAGLAPRPGRGNQPRPKYAATPVELLERFYAIYGVQPGCDGLARWAKANGIPYAQETRTRKWNECVDEWKAERRAKNLPVPDGPPTAGNCPDYGRDVGAALPGEREKLRNRWGDIEDAIACILLYLEQLPPGRRSSASDYNDWAKGQSRCSACSSFGQFGGWGAVRRLALERLK